LFLKNKYYIATILNYTNILIMALVQVLEHKLAEIFFDEENSYFYEIYSSQTEFADDDEFKNYQHTKLEVAKKCLPKIFLCDTKNFKYVISNKMQEWVDKVVMGFWDNSPLQKLAFLASSELVSQVSLELAMSENTHKYPIMYFDNKEDALKWLMND